MLSPRDRSNEKELEALQLSQLSRLFATHWLVRCLKNRPGAAVGLKPLYGLFYADFCAFRKSISVNVRYTQCYELFYSELEYLVLNGLLSSVSEIELANKQSDQVSKGLGIFDDHLIHHAGYSFLKNVAFDATEIERMNALSPYFQQRPRPYYRQAEYELNFLAFAMRTRTPRNSYLFEYDLDKFDEWRNLL